MATEEPRSPTCLEVDSRLWRYIDRELPATRISEISAHLKECEECRALYHDRAATSGLLTRALADGPFGDAFAEKFSVRLGGEIRSGLPAAFSERRESRSSTPGFSRSGWGRSPFYRRRAWVLGGVGATLAATFALFALWFLIPSVSLGSFESTGAPVVAGMTDGRGPGVRGAHSASRGAVRPGSTFEVPVDSVLALALERVPGVGFARLEVTGPASFTVDPSATNGTFRGCIEEGSVKVKVTPLRGREGFVVETPHASSSVVGTEFILKVDREATLLTVLEGKVRFEAKGAEDSLAVVTRETGARVVRRQVSRIERPEEGVPIPTVSSAEPPVAAQVPGVGDPALPPTVPPPQTGSTGSIILDGGVPSADLDNPTSPPPDPDPEDAAPATH